MKNPYMSAWLSMANQGANMARGQMMAEMQRQQTEMIHAWQKAWIEAWMTMMFPTGVKGKKRR